MNKKQKEAKYEAFSGTEHFIKLLFSINKEKYNINEEETAHWIRNIVNIFEKGAM